MRTLLEDSKSTDVKFNHEQCKYLATKLEWAIHCALLESHFPENLAAPEDAAKCHELYMILLMLAKEVEGFIERCSKENWMQAAVIFANMPDHVWSLSFDLELCTMFFSFKKSRCLTSEEFSDIRSLELNLVKEKALIDDETLSACVKALIESGEASDNDFELATILLARIVRLRQQSSHLGTSQSLQLSLHERADFSSLKYDVRIGNGGFATVYKAIWCGVEVAVKTFHGPENPEFRKEVSICARVTHPNTASLLFYGVENGECSIVMELMDGDLQSLMRTRLRCNRTRESPFCMFVVLDLMLQIAEGMSYLHKLRIVHRDLKSYNILVRFVKSTEADGHEYVHAKVADFGLSKTKEKSMTYSNQTPNMGTTRWMAPEMFEQGRLVNKEAYPFKSDVYSFAMVCYEILTGKFPFTTVSSNAEIKRKVLAGDRPELPAQCPSKLRRLIERCWSPEARARPRFGDICLELAYLKSLQTSCKSLN